MLIMGLALANALRYEKSPPSLWSSLGHAGPEHDDTEGIITLSTDSNRMDDAVGGHLNVKGHRKAREWLRKSYPIWKQWTGYLVREALIPSNQLSTDDFAGWLANNTNLALKGILGIRAMSELAAIVGETDEAISYYKTSREYITRWHTEFAMSRDGTHAKLAYTWYGSWSMLYNLFADSLLCFHLPASSGTARQLQKEDAPVDEQSHTAFVPSLVYTRQSEWYLNVLQKYGIPLDSRHLYTKSDWEFFAVSVASKQVREEVIDRIALWVNETTTDKPLTDLYDTESEWYPGIEFKARPVVGGHFAYLALERACGGRALEGLKFLDDALVEDARPARAREQLERQHILSAEEL